MLVLGIETSCDETGLAVYDTGRGLLAHALHSQVAMHAIYGGVVPELASRDHVRRVVPLAQRVLARRGRHARRSRRHRLHAGSGPRGRASGRRQHCQRARLCARQAGNRRPSHGRPSALAAPGRSEARVSVRRLARFGWTQPVVRSRRSSGGTACSATPRTTRPARPSTRRRSCWAWIIPADPRSRAWRRRAVTARSAAATDARERGSRHELLRLEDRRAPARSPRGRAGNARRRATRRHRARVPARGGRRARGEGAGGARRDGSASGSSWPAAWAPIANCARVSRRRSASAAGRCSFPISNSARTTAR